MSNYNPFNAEGRYNLEVYLYENKRAILGFTIVFIVLFIGLALYVWSSSGRSTSGPPKTLPPPKYGFGPYGYGLYAPPKEILENPPDIL